MLKLLPLALLATLSLSVSAAEARRLICTAPIEDWQPADALIARLKGQGLVVQSVRLDHGCYAIRATDAAGDARRGLYDPVTLDPMAGADERRDHREDDGDAAPRRDGG